MEWAAVLGFAAVALTLIVVPGPDWAFILGATARHRAAVAPAVGGLMVGYALITAVIVAGVVPLIAAAPFALYALTVAGAVYLMYLGVRMLRSSTGNVGGDAHTQKRVAALTPSRGLVLRGVGVSALNPKGLLIFLSILPQFTRPNADLPVRLQLAALGGVFIALCGAFYLLFGYTSARLLDTHPGAARVITRVAGVAMIIVGLLLLAERLLWG